MARFLTLFTRSIALSFSLLLFGCNTYHHSPQSNPVNNLSQLNAHYVPVRNGHIEYYRFGKGSPIVLIPGFVTDVSSWDRKFLATLAQNHEVIVPNNRNVGRSFVRSAHYESRDLANDTYQLMQTLKLKQPAVLGLSMGGMIAQQLAVLHPHDIGQLILINTAIAGERSVRPSQRVQNKILNMPVSKLGRYATAVELFFPDSWKLSMAYALAVDRFQPQDFQAIDPRAVISQQRHVVLNWSKDDTIAKKLRQLNIPTLILNGGSDDVIPPVNSVILARTIPRAKLLRWQEGGHAMIYQYPVSIAQTINRFLANRI